MDFYNLTSILPQEAVARIKDKPVVTLTILRGLLPPSNTSSSPRKQGTLNLDHIYDEILYADQQLSQNLSQQDDGIPPFMTTGLIRDPSFASRRHRAQIHEENSLHNKHVMHIRSTSPGVMEKEFNHRHHHLQPFPMTKGNHSTLPGEKGSKDSGLSSGSSDSPEHKDRGFKGEDGVVYPEDAPFERLTNLRQSYRTEREMLKNFLKTKKKEAAEQLEVEETDSRRNCRIEGDYEVEVRL